MTDKSPELVDLVQTVKGADVAEQQGRPPRNRTHRGDSVRAEPGLNSRDIS